MSRGVHGWIAAFLVFGLLTAADADAAPGAWSRIAPNAVTSPDAIATSPTDPNTVYVALGSGGIAKSTNGGASWTHLGRANGLATGRSTARALEVDPSSPQTLYVADIQRVFRSTDGGLTFAAVGAAGAPGRTEALAVKAGAGPADTKVLAAGVGFETPPSGGTVGPKVFLSTDAGNTWQDKSGNLTVAEALSLASAVEFHPTNLDVAYVATSNDTLYRTLNLTNASPTWTAIGAAPLTGLPLDLEAVSGAPNRLVAATRSGVFRSDNAGNIAVPAPTWATTGLSGTSEDVAAIGTGGSTFLASNEAGLFSTGNISGTTWSELGGGLTGGTSSAVGVAPSDTGVLYAHSLDTVFRSANGGISWTARPGIVAASVEALATAGGTVWAAAESLGLLMTDDAGASWVKAGVPAGVSVSEVAAAPSDPAIVLVGSFSGQIRRSANGGASFGAPSPSSPTNLRQLAFDPEDATLAYAAADDTGVFRSTDGGQSWTQSNAGLPNLADWEADHLAVAASPGAGPGVVYAARDIGFNGVPMVVASANGGQSWQAQSNGLPTGVTGVQDLAADPNDSNVLYAVIDASLFRTINGGGSWAAVAATGVTGGGFFDQVAISPRNGRVVLGRNGQIFESTDNGASFHEISIPESFQDANDIAFDDETKALHLATSSSGLLDFGFIADVSAQLSGPATATVGDELTYNAVARADGPDLVTGLSLEAPLPAGLQPVAATPSSGACTLGQTISCDLGDPATGAPVTVAIKVKAIAPGTQAIAINAEGLQADLDPADNDASVTTVVNAPPGPPPDPVRVTPTLSMKVKPTSDPESPHIFKPSGQLSFTGVGDEACSGDVEVVAKKGKREVETKSAKLKIRNGNCTYKTKLRFNEAPAKKLKLGASFAGNTLLEPATSKQVKVKLA